MTYPFWSKDKHAINSRQLVKFLQTEGFGQFQTSNGRTSGKTIFRRQNNILQVHNAESVRRVLTSIIDKDQDMTEDQKDGILDKIIRMAPSTLNNYLTDLPVWSIQEYEGTIKLDVFMDNAKECYLPFMNGVIVITKDAIDLKEYSVLESGCIWETSRIQHHIKLFENNTAPEKIKNTFRDFVHFALKMDVEPHLDDLENAYDAGTDNTRYAEAKRAFETGYGYLIHNYNPPDEMKMIVFADIESSATRAEGRNGKSLTMSTLKYYKNTEFIDGKSFRKSMNESSRFNFSNVKIDTRLVVINDLNPDLDLTQLFSQISDDFTIEGKGTNKIIIPRERKPKMCCNTNYVLSGNGASYDGRQHIVDFGNYFNRCAKRKIQPKDILGQLVGDDFTEDDWDAFYAYGFYCVQQYLRYGLHKSENSSYERKHLIQTVEGEAGTGELVDWLENWCQTTRVDNNFHIDGISEEELYRSFITDNPELASTWTKGNFNSAVFDFATNADGYDYNPHNASKGNTKSKRKWRKGPQGAQVYYVKITHASDM